MFIYIWLVDITVPFQCVVADSRHFCHLVSFYMPIGGSQRHTFTSVPKCFVCMFLR